MIEHNTRSMSFLSLIVVSGLLILTAWGNAWVMFWCALVAMIAVLIWNVVEHKNYNKT